ncbi:hypothetical protein JOJ88_003130 [Pantoea cypripedii]|nr:hypothetical protein [Pantoea cypripedii]
MHHNSATENITTCLLMDYIPLTSLLFVRVRNSIFWNRISHVEI